MPFRLALGVAAYVPRHAASDGIRSLAGAAILGGVRYNEAWAVGHVLAPGINLFHLLSSHSP